MNLSFFKYQGTGNDFVIIDDREGSFNRKNSDLVAKLCDRRFGIGADGLILLGASQTSDFEMVYYNADRKLSCLCGNGGRCITAFAKRLGVITDKATFGAADGTAGGCSPYETAHSPGDVRRQTSRRARSRSGARAT